MIEHEEHAMDCHKRKFTTLVNELFEQERDSIARVAFRANGSLTPDQLADIVTDVFVILLILAKRIEEGVKTPPRDWARFARGVAWKLAKEQSRITSRRKEVTLLETDMKPHPLVEDYDPQSTVFRVRKLIEWVKSERDRKILLLWFFWFEFTTEQPSQPDIASACGTSVSTMKRVITEFQTLCLERCGELSGEA